MHPFFGCFFIILFWCYTPPSYTSYQKTSYVWDAFRSYRSYYSIASYHHKTTDLLTSMSRHYSCETDQITRISYTPHRSTSSVWYSESPSFSSESWCENSCPMAHGEFSIGIFIPVPFYISYILYFYVRYQNSHCSSGVYFGYFHEQSARTQDNPVSFLNSPLRCCIHSASCVCYDWYHRQGIWSRAREDFCMARIRFARTLDDIFSWDRYAPVVTIDLWTNWNRFWHHIFSLYPYCSCFTRCLHCFWVSWYPRIFQVSSGYAYILDGITRLQSGIPVPGYRIVYGDCILWSILGWAYPDDGNPVVDLQGDDGIPLFADFIFYPKKIPKCYKHIKKFSVGFFILR